MQDPVAPPSSGPPSPSIQSFGPSEPDPGSPPTRPRSVGKVILAIAGALVLLFGILACVVEAHQGPVNAFATSLLACGGWLMLMSGALHRSSDQTRAMARRVGSVMIMLLFTVAGPSVSTSSMKSTEERRFRKLEAAKTDPTIDLFEWQLRYRKLDERFRREGWEDAWMQVRIERAVQDEDEAELRAILEEIESQPTVDYSEARPAVMTHLKDAPSQ